MPFACFATESYAMNNRTTLGTVAVALCLSGCGGGGGGGFVSVPVIQPAATTAVATTNTPVAGSDAFRTVEYNRMGALEAVHAADAYALGYTGAGVTIGIVDFNFDFTTAEVNFHPDSVGPDPNAVALYVAQTGEAAVSDQHGQAVASTAAARKNDFGIHGIAFDAHILAVDYFSNVNETQSVQGGVLYHISDPFSYITSRGVRIVNTSFGYEAGDVIVNPPQVSEIYDIATPATAVFNGALLVAAAGNASGANPSLYNINIISDLSAAGALDSGPGALIIAGAVDSNNRIASFSDRAGRYANYYMVAPGVNLMVPWNGGLAVVSGTSFAAPLISGAAAIIIQRWPDLTARQVANILFASATDLGAPGVDSVYGHGLLNIAAALQPLGVSTLAVAGGGAPVVSGTGLVLGAVFGDAPALHAALSAVMMLDGFGRDFEIDLSRVAGLAPQSPRYVRRVGKPARLAFGELPSGFRYRVRVRRAPQTRGRHGSVRGSRGAHGPLHASDDVPSFGHGGRHVLGGGDGSLPARWHGGRERRRLRRSLSDQCVLAHGGRSARHVREPARAA